jgi:hypothetical protein
VTSSAPATTSALDALPVELRLARPDAARVTAWVEGVVGWQPVDGATGGLVPRVRLTDVAATSRADAVAAPASPAALPAVLLLVAGDDPPIAVASAVQRLRPAAVVAWPDARDELAAVVASLLAASPTPHTDEVALRIGGAAGGVGTTTVALALGALAAWRSGPTLVLTAGAVPLALPRTVELDTLAGPRTFAEATPVAGVPSLRVLRCAGHAREAAVDAGPARVLVRDVGVTDEADVLVLRRDDAGLAGLERSAAAVAVLLDDGVVPPTAVAAAAGGRRVVSLPRSVRVARAGALRRVPVALPASYLRPLGVLVPREARRGR